MRLVERGWLSPGEVAISAQVLQEMQVNLERPGISRTDAALIIREFSEWPVVDNTLGLLLTALDEQARWQVSLGDALILAAARVSGASASVTEDFNHGQDYGGVRALNPFR